MAASALIAWVICYFPATSGRANAASLPSAEEFFSVSSFTSIPEPGALVSLIGGAAVLIGIQRFRHRN